MATETLNLYQKLLKITEEVGKIDKTGRNSAQGYAFIEQAQVVAEVRAQLAKHGVMILPETTSRSIERFVNAKGTNTVHANIVSRYTIVNADNPDEKFTAEWDGGEALDTSDKATNKAITASHKYFLMKLFNISDKDDPDADSPQPPSEPSQSANRPLKSEGVVFINGKKLDPDFEIKLNKLRLTMARKNINGDTATAYITEKIGKPAPTTEAEVDKLLLALEEPF